MSKTTVKVKIRPDRWPYLGLTIGRYDGQVVEGTLNDMGNIEFLTPDLLDAGFEPEMVYGTPRQTLMLDYVLEPTEVIVVHDA